jgi:hypothetical protein
MTPLSISEKLDSVIDTALAAAEVRTYKLDGVRAPYSDIAEIVFSFESAENLYLSWEQRGDWNELSVRETSHLLADAFAGGTAEMEAMVGEVVHELFTRYELFADQDHCLAVRLTFDTRVVVIAVGHEAWNEEQQRGEFTNFSGDDLFLWSDDTFTAFAQAHDLSKVAENSAVARA